MSETKKLGPGELRIEMSKEFRNKPLSECTGMFIWDVVDMHGPIESHSSLENAVRARSTAKVLAIDVDRYVDKIRQLTKDRITS